MNYYFKALQNYAVFSGRARRKEYWMFTLFNTIFSVLLMMIEMGDTIIYTIYSLAVLVPSIAVGVRRMHDVGKSGWCLLIPIYNFVLAVTDSEQAENEYGPNPKA